MVLELERAQRVGDALDRVGLAVSPVVGRVDAPRRPRAVVVRMEDAVEHRVAEVHVRRGHVDLRAQRVLAVGELAAPHALEEVEVLFHGPVAVRAVAARLVPAPPVGARFVRAQAADVRLALADQLERPVVELIEVVGGVESLSAPIETEPAYIAFDRFDVLCVLRGRVRVVEAQVAVTAVLLGNAEVEADRLCVPDVEVAVRFRREAGDDAAAVLPRGHIGTHLLADEVERFGRAGIVGHGGVGAACCEAAKAIGSCQPRTTPCARHRAHGWNAGILPAAGAKCRSGWRWRWFSDGDGRRG